MNNSLLIAFADALDARALKLNEGVEDEAENFCDEEAAEYVWTCATAGTVAMLISAAIRDAIDDQNETLYPPPGRH